MMYLQLFWSFVQVGLFSIGGGYAAMPLIESEIVRGHGWLSVSEFTDLITIAEMTPGPIAVNAATFVGIRIAGLPGALVATFGCIFPSMLIVSALAYIYYRYKTVSLLQSVLASLRPVVVALIASAGLTVLQLVAFRGAVPALTSVEWAGLAIFAGAFLILRIKKWNPIGVMSLCGAAGLAVGLLRDVLP